MAITVIREGSVKRWWVIDAPSTPEGYGYHFHSQRAAQIVAKQFLEDSIHMAFLLDAILTPLPKFLRDVL
jgi:hypothetical protein